MSRTVLDPDRRRQRTQQAIFDAFAGLFAVENYSDITVQQIIREANIGRSTFYDHYQSKEDLLDDLCVDMFHHVASPRPSTLQDHGFEQRPGELMPALTHLLFHLREDNARLRGLLTGTSSGLFLKKIKPYLHALVKDELRADQHCYLCDKVPEDFLINHIVGCFTTAVDWWASHDFKESPITLNSYLCTLLPAEITAGEHTSIHKK
ncbi:TetR/AcrR family transcriptional regulator [Bifidobacterium psychraerophilum]|jgi:AcrR family transcriptional regulator|uniref:TetR/AcrR family transcriptional regulator n=1 Tax=Bifidobacterium psychraerophilum TaxID=218140 RepID=UPI0023560184|nr:TetR/AcrR family transcriptional regulator [Bifidobacterium crudilactis]